MMNIEKFVALVFGLLVVTAVAFPFVAYQLEQPRQHEVQTKFLRRNIARLQLHKGRVFLRLRGPGRITAAGRDMFDEQPQLFDVGSQWKAADRHWSATYTLTGIDANGVVMHYEADGREPSSIRPSSGNVKLLWK